MTSTLAPPSQAGALSPARRWAVLAVILAAEVLDLIDATIATITNLAAPSITASLKGGPSLAQWLGASYALALGVLLVVGGRPRHAPQPPDRGRHHPRLLPAPPHRAAQHH
ncbi:hypothetical protein ACIRG4_02220 [Streptomyces sp. NPDC102395]|uniref:hypothetical protein n=1 Tax=Streptomyces sp. NPDC102395 TaxID=3366168 RepID=UPI003801D585